jgi:pyruvate/2-oxoglutarate dehydrogenase complex dihydrolipoamide acyltransferase (E2) component
MANRSDPIIDTIERLIADEDLHDHLGNAAEKLNAARNRIRRRGLKSAEDKKVYAQVRAASRSLLEATRIVKQKPKPKHRGRKIAVAAAVAGGTALAVKRMSDAQSPPATT